MVLYSEIGEKIDIGKVLQMITIHDLAEIYAGDHHAWKGVLENKQQLEREALSKLLQHLPKEKKEELTTIWEEFEERKSLESKFAQAVEKIETLIQHNEADLATWNETERGDFNLVYASDKCEFNAVIKELREIVRKETQKKLEIENKSR
jgi:putative hydrolase of HD superfamily